MPDYTVLDEKFIFESGTVYLHVVQVGAPVDLAQVICERVPVHCQDFVLENAYQEGKTIIRHHLEMYYPYRGPVRLRPENWSGDESELLMGVMWRRTDRSRMSALIQSAAELFWGNYDRSPSRVLVRKLPKNAPERLALAGACQGEVMFREMDWIPTGCIIVCEEARHE